MKKVAQRRVKRKRKKEENRERRFKRKRKKEENRERMFKREIRKGAWKEENRVVQPPRQPLLIMKDL